MENALSVPSLGARAAHRSMQHAGCSDGCVLVCVHVPLIPAFVSRPWASTSMGS